MIKEEEKPIMSHIWDHINDGVAEIFIFACLTMSFLAGILLSLFTNVAVCVLFLCLSQIIGYMILDKRETKRKAKMRELLKNIEDREFVEKIKNILSIKD